MPTASDSSLSPTSSEVRPLGADLQRILQLYARLLIGGGLFVLALAMGTDWRWTAQPVTLIVPSSPGAFSSQYRDRRDRTRRSEPPSARSHRTRRWGKLVSKSKTSVCPDRLRETR